MPSAAEARALYRALLREGAFCLVESARRHVVACFFGGAFASCLPLRSHTEGPPAFICRCQVSQLQRERVSAALELELATSEKGVALLYLQRRRGPEGPLSSCAPAGTSCGRRGQGSGRRKPRTRPQRSSCCSRGGRTWRWCGGSRRSLASTGTSTRPSWSCSSGQQAS